MRRFAPPLLLMAVIFFLSAQPDLNSGLGVWDTIGRKFVHAAVYGTLWFLWWRALRLRSPIPAIAITLLYAITDEYHQTFVHGRHGSPIDVLIDATGVAIALLLVSRRGTRAARRPRTGGPPPAEAPTP